MILRTVVRRAAQMVFVMFGISVIVFLIFFATPASDPAARIAGRGASPEVLAQVRESFGLNKPLPVQYTLMMKKLLVTRDLSSYVNRGMEVVPQIIQAAPVTLSLIAGAAILWVTMGLLVGVLAAAWRNTPIDTLLMAVALIGISIPDFWLGQVINLISQSQLHDTVFFSWVPPMGYQSLLDSPVGWFKSLALPWFALSVLYIGLYGRILRADLVETMQEDFIRTARAKGLSEKRVLLRHGLRCSMLTFVTMFGMDFGALVGGAALLIEVVFNLHGVGFLLYSSLQTLDLPMIMGCVIYSSFFIVTMNALVDIGYVFLDPRVRHE